MQSLGPKYVPVANPASHYPLGMYQCPILPPEATLIHRVRSRLMFPLHTTQQMPPSPRPHSEFDLHIVSIRATFVYPLDT